MQHRCFAASGLLPLVLIEMLIVAAALLAIGSSLTATIRGIVLSATVQADPLRGCRPSVPSSAHGSQQATSMGWRQVRGIRPSNVWTPLHRKPATYRVEYNAVLRPERSIGPSPSADGVCETWRHESSWGCACIRRYNDEHGVRASAGA